MKLLDLPDELLSTIILETMWATTTNPSNPPDLLMHERRLTNHPSILREDVAFVGQICGRMRRIAQPLLKPAQLWEDPAYAIQSSGTKPIAYKVPASLMIPSITAISCFKGQAVLLPQLPSATLERLTELSIKTGDGGYQKYADKVLRSIGSCRQLQHLAINLLIGSAGGVTKLFAGIASIPSLQSLVLDELYSGHHYPGPALSLSLGQTWTAPLVRLELTWCRNITFRRCVQLMGKVAATLQVAIFHHNDDGTYSTLESSSAAVASFPHLWRLNIGFGVEADPRYRDHYAPNASTDAGRQQLAQCSPITVWKAAPRLEYFDCSEEIVVRTQKELDEVGELRQREEMKRLRIKLETWEGDKGAGWSTDKMQEIVVG